MNIPYYLVVGVVLLLIILILMTISYHKSYAQGLEKLFLHVDQLMEEKSGLQEVVALKSQVIMDAFSVELQKQLIFQQNYLRQANEQQLNNISQLKVKFDQGVHNQHQALINLQNSVSTTFGEVRKEIQSRLDTMFKENHQSLESIRKTVDEKLHKTLEDRLGKSFALVSDQLQQVQRGLGEMQELANGVGDLKKVLSNVKTRGIMGEIQLHTILEQLLTPEQYALNVATIPGKQNHVEFAIKLPGKDIDNHPVWLPIDAKFPMDVYNHLLEAYDQGDKGDLIIKRKALRKTLLRMAKDIQEKYIAPPHTTDFGILFLPTEGLYAEAIRESDFVMEIQRDYKILLAGPTNLAALLNSLQMGFRSLAIEQRSSDVWKVLSNVKTEFGKFGGVLEKVQKKLNEASNTIDKVGIRSRAIERNLKHVESVDQKALSHPFSDGVGVEDFKLPIKK